MRTYGTLSTLMKDGDVFWRLNADPHVTMRAKRMFNRLSHQVAGDLQLRHGDETCADLAWFLDRYPLTMSDEDRARLMGGAAAYRDTRASLEQIMGAAYEPRPFQLVLPPRSYQAREAEILLQVKGLLIGDDVGLGKTAASICAFTDPRTLPAVVVTLAHLPRQWAAEVQKFAPGLFVHVIKKGTPYELPRFVGAMPDVLVINYHKLSNWAQVLRRYCKTVVFDEIQELRHSDSAKYAAAKSIADAMVYRLGLSATPIYNYGGEIFNVLDVLRPGALGTISEFVNEWCTNVSGDPKTARLKNPSAFGAWAREQFLIVRHTRRDVGRELPQVIRIPQRVDVDQAPLDSVKNTADELAKLLLSQSPEAFRGERLRAAEEITMLLRQATGVAKAPYVADFVRLLVESGERVVLCGWHRAVYDIWKAKLHDLHPEMYTGSESDVQKHAAKSRFVSGESKVLILSLRSGAGLNGLQEASSVIVFGELDWSPGVHEQCIGRLNRDGQMSPVVAYFLVSDTGSDPAVSEVLGLKREQVEGIRNPGDDFIEKLEVDGSHARRLAESYLTQRGIAVPKPEESAA